jgi:hypothetical protein
MMDSALRAREETNMSNFLKDLKEAIGEEVVEAVVFTSLLDQSYLDKTPEPRNAGIETDKIYSWEEAQPLLDYEYDAGYGGSDCHFVNIWTPTRVIYIHEYDGATWPEFVPRNPK